MLVQRYSYLEVSYPEVRLYEYIYDNARACNVRQMFLEWNGNLNRLHTLTCLRFESRSLLSTESI